MLISPPTEQQPLRAMIGPGGYAEPVVPIRVNMVRDEEALGGELDGSRSEATKVPPPAYGLWRESVVCLPLHHCPFKYWTLEHREEV